ncbi:hypothetical protein CFC21_072137 [Triticum aestivum]|uniref:DUF295 domain-containing protein n=2 Tax=Triticum aestivum TaxID=4565 RepID=A0A9R1HHP2_WHEAT|nr:hypothetical protein CFC21_022583 [Triticum aestivum]KAF7066093.1 hypothetical protein CFC21_072137 [Triticum aestivum]
MGSVAARHHDRDRAVGADDQAVLCANFCRPGDGSWSPVECSELDQVSSITYCDGVFYLFDGVFYQVHARRVVRRFPRDRQDALPAPRRIGRLEGALQGLPLGAWDRRRRNRTGWAEVDDIGDRAVFVDGFCVGANGVRRNCMYVASSYQDGSYTKGRYIVSVLDLAGLTTERLSLGNLGNCRCRPFCHWPSWIHAQSALIQIQQRTRIEVAGNRSCWFGSVFG